MQAALARVPGVEDVRVDFLRRTAHVTCGADVGPQELVTALEKAGFGARVTHER